MKFTNTVIFTGPSLSPEQAQKIIPDAQYHPPIQCGDVIKTLRTGAQRIIIIDGYFEQRGAVWHKEILFALSLGIPVYGASSMGALRASELHMFGMQGFGKIFEHYRDGITFDDDEVALVHADQFDSHITPMMNIRPTLQKAVQHQVLSQETAESLLTDLKQTPYYNRSLFNITSEPHLNTWFLENYVDQKKLDAENLLLFLKHQRHSPNKSPNLFLFPPSAFFNRIFREMIVEPFDQALPWLSESEKNYLGLKTQQPLLFQTLQRIAKLLHLGLDIAKSQKKPISHDQTGVFLITFKDHCPLSAAELLNALKIELDFNALQDPSNHLSTQSALDLLSQLLAGLIGFMTQQGLSISARFAQTYANEFRRARRLLSTQETMAWIEKNNLATQADFEKLIISLCPLHYIVDQHNSHSIGLGTTLECYDWLGLGLNLLNRSQTL